MGQRRDRSVWTLPGGGSNPGETPEQAASRELQEETSLVVAPADLKFRMKTTLRNKDIYVFTTKVDGTASGRLDPDQECAKWEWIDVSQGLPRDIAANMAGPPKEDNVLKDVVGYGTQLSKSQGPKIEPFLELLPKSLVVQGYRLEVVDSNEGSYHTIQAVVSHPSAGQYELDAGLEGPGVARLDAMICGGSATVMGLTIPSPDHQGLGLPFAMAQALFKYIATVQPTCNVAGMWVLGFLNQMALAKVAKTNLLTFTFGTKGRSTHFSLPTYTQQNDEIGRHLKMPQKAEKTLALKMDGVSDKHLEHALEYGLYDDVWNHAKFSEATLKHYCSDSRMASFLPRCVTHPLVQAEHLDTILDSALYTDNEEILALQVARNGRLGPHTFKRLMDFGIPEALCSVQATPEVLQYWIDWAKADSSNPVVVEMAAGGLRNQAVTPEFFEAAVKDGSVDFQLAALALGTYLPYGWASDQFLKGQVSAESKDSPSKLRLAILNHPKLNISLALKGVQDKAIAVNSLAKFKTMEGSGLNKSEGYGSDSTKSAELAYAMAGQNWVLESWLEAAQVLSGGKAPDLAKVRTSWALSDGNVCETALMSVGLSLTDKNLQALAGIKSMLRDNQPWAKSLQDPLCPFKVVRPILPAATQIAQGIQEAVELGLVVPLDMGGKHSRGTYVAKAAGKAWLLKLGSGQNNPAAGVAQEPAGQARREAAFYDAAATMGMSQFLCPTYLLDIDGQEYAAIELLPTDYSTAEKIKAESPTYITMTFQNRLNVFYMAAVDYILGNPDRHSGNILLNDYKTIKLIDHGSALAGSAFSPLDQYTFTPYYLRAKYDGNFQKLPAAEKASVIGLLNEEERRDFKIWLTGLDENMVSTALSAYGVDSQACVGRLLKLKTQAYQQPADQVLVNAWLGL